MPGSPRHRARWPRAPACVWLHRLEQLAELARPPDERRLALRLDRLQRRRIDCRSAGQSEDRHARRRVRAAQRARRLALDLAAQQPLGVEARRALRPAAAISARGRSPPAASDRRDRTPCAARPAQLARDHQPGVNADADLEADAAFGNPLRAAAVAPRRRCSTRCAPRGGRHPRAPAGSRRRARRRSPKAVAKRPPPRAASSRIERLLRVQRARRAARDRARRPSGLDTARRQERTVTCRRSPVGRSGSPHVELGAGGSRDSTRLSARSSPSIVTSRFSTALAVTVASSVRNRSSRSSAGIAMGPSSELLENRFLHRGAAHRQLSGQALEEDQPPRVEVGAGRRRLAAQLLGRRVARACPSSPASR